MKYEGKLYGKVGNRYFQLEITSKDVDNLIEKNAGREEKIKISFDENTKILIWKLFNLGLMIYDEETNITGRDAEDEAIMLLNSYFKEII